MDVIFGQGPVAAGLAGALAAEGSVALVCDQPVDGPWFWRRGSRDTGEGVAQGLRSARRLFLVLDDASEATGFFALVKPGTVDHAVVILPLGTWLPEGLGRHDGWATVRVGPVWSSSEPLVQAWTARAAQGRAIWTADPGVLRPVAAIDLAAAASAASIYPGVQWSLAGPDVHLPELAAQAAGGRSVPLRRVPLALAAWRAGVPSRRIRAWLRSADAARHTPGWDAPLASPDRWVQ